MNFIGVPSEEALRSQNGNGQRGKPLGAEACAEPQKSLRALYITGHSLGGAMAALAAAQIWMDSKYRKLREKLCGVYTYGAPMVAAPELARVLHKDVGHAVFRHVYRKDIVPRLPPVAAGRFEHFGMEYRSNGGDDGWELSRHSSQVWSASSLLVGAAAWAAAQLPLLSNIRLPVSWDHHSPRYYMRASNLSLGNRL